MSFRRMAVAVFLLLLCTADAFAQRPTLTEDELAEAIAVGLKAKGREQGLELRETGLLRMSGDGTSGFSLVVYTPTTWIQHLASQAAKQYRPFTRADVTDDMRAPVLRVIAHADTPKTLDVEARRRAASVEHIVLQDRRRRSVLQPASIEPFETEVSNALGAAQTYTGLSATFPLEGVRPLRGAGGGDEFTITIVGSGRDSLGRARNEKHFEIKRGHFSRLP